MRPAIPSTATGQTLRLATRSSLKHQSKRRSSKSLSWRVFNSRIGTAKTASFASIQRFSVSLMGLGRRTGTTLKTGRYTMSVNCKSDWLRKGGSDTSHIKARGELHTRFRLAKKRQKFSSGRTALICERLSDPQTIGIIFRRLISSSSAGLSRNAGKQGQRVARSFSCRKGKGFPNPPDRETNWLTSTTLSPGVVEVMRIWAMVSGLVQAAARGTSIGNS